MSEIDIQSKLTGALEEMKRVLFPIFMQLAERELVDDPVADDAILFSFMGSGASDYVTVGEYRKALLATNEALSLVYPAPISEPPHVER